MAKKRGYTETAWGRRRYLSHIRDEEYTFKYNDKRPIDFNPLLTVKSEVNLDVPQDVKDDLIQQLNNTKNNYYRTKLVEQLKEDGIDVTNNHKYIADAERQCVNSVIQRKCSRHE